MAGDHAMTPAERDRLKDFLWLILPVGSRSPNRLDWLVDAIETGAFPPTLTGHKAGQHTGAAGAECHQGAAGKSDRGAA